MLATKDLRALRRAKLLSAVQEVPGLLSLSGRVTEVIFRGRRCTLVGRLDRFTLAQRPEPWHRPITDLTHLEFVSGEGQHGNWRRPAVIDAIIEARQDPMLAVERASRWASYATRVAVVPAERMTSAVALEASLRGVWVVTAGDSVAIAQVGEHGPASGSLRGLMHRHLDELLAAALHG